MLILGYAQLLIMPCCHACYVDIPGHQTPAGGTFPPDVIVSTLKPDLVVLDKKNKKAAIFELTCPAEHRIEAAHTLKEQKYSHFTSDIQHYEVTVDPFEIGSHTGYITKPNRKRLGSIHKFCKKSIKLKSFIHNISAITVLGSYYIFNCRSQALWAEMAPILAPFPNQ